jgi:adenosylcobinamide-phosphate synthase
MLHATAMLVALTIDFVLGWPNPLFRHLGHPVTWIGALIALLDKQWNRGRFRRVKGIAAALLVIAICASLAAFVQAQLPSGFRGALIAGIMAWPLVAARALHQHVAAVAVPLKRGDLPAARQAVSMIVGRDPAGLSEPGIARAALESLAENSSDGILAPLFWGTLLGLPGVAAYKAINTLDSMIGHLTPRHESFGGASARIDDLANSIPARLTGLLFALCSDKPTRSLACMGRDARHHRSPNGGWPESAMAGALSIRLSGPRIYAGQISEEPWINASGRDPDANSILAGLALYRRILVVTALLLAAAML